MASRHLELVRLLRISKGLNNFCKCGFVLQMRELTEMKNPSRQSQDGFLPEKRLISAIAVAVVISFLEITTTTASVSTTASAACAFFTGFCYRYIDGPAIN